MIWNGHVTADVILYLQYFYLEIWNKENKNSISKKALTEQSFMEENEVINGTPRGMSRLQSTK